jgi:hypothetical protein
MTRGIATLAATMAVIPLLAGCAERYPAAASAGDAIPYFSPPPRVREPSSSRPPWLLPQPPNPERLRVPDDGFMDQLG